VELRFDSPSRPNEVVVDCAVRVQGRTGVEMEVRVRAFCVFLFYVSV
jgi:molybdenum cofactor biosynthesis enzyme